MSSSALFASSAGRSHSKNLVEFKAGKMTMKGKMVHPDKRKGLLYVYQSEDSLMHFCWKDRGTGSVEDDLIIFPDDCEFKRVEACTTGRVFVLKFKSSSRKLFFWLQEPKSEKDDEHCKKVNEMLNSPPTAGASRSGGGTPDELQNLLGSMSQQQLMQLFGTFGPGGSGGVQLPSTLSSLLGTMNRSANNGSSTPTSGSSSARTSAAADKASTPTPSDSAKKSSSSSSTNSSSKSTTSAAPATPAQPTILLSDLQRYLNNIRPVSTPGTPSVEVDLSDALLNSESIQGVLDNPNLVQELSPHLPDVSSVSPDQSDPERLRSTLLSPQFQQAVSSFGAALRSGQIGPVIQQFDMSEPAVLAAVQGNMEEFVKALEKANITPEKGEGSSSDPKSDSKDKKEEGEDEKMNED